MTNKMFEDLYKGLSVKDKKEFQELTTFGKKLEEEKGVKNE